VESSSYSGDDSLRITTNETQMKLSPFQKFDEESNRTSFSSRKLFDQVQQTWPLLVTKDATDHGVDHWERVHSNARRLAESEGLGGSVYTFEAVELFAMFHDCQRYSEYDDAEHGMRAASLLMDFMKWNFLRSYSVNAIYAAARACALHTDLNPRDGAFSDLKHYTMTTDNIYDHILMICLDADRLDLGRVGINTHERFLFTESAKMIVRNDELWRPS
jgi:hypothetical protein